MMPVIRVSDDTFRRLQGHATPLQDTADDVVRRALDALEVAPKGVAPKAVVSAPQAGLANALPRKAKLPQKEFRAPLLALMKKLGGRADIGNVRAMIEPILKPLLKEGDLDPVSNGDPRWWNAVCWERKALVEEGIFRRDFQRGVWELSPVGRDLVGLG